MLVAGIRHLLATVAFRQHNHAATVGLQQIDVRVHAPGGGWPQRTGRIALRRFGRAGVVDRVILDVLRQAFTAIQTLFQLGVRDIAADDDGAAQRQAGGNRILRQLLEDPAIGRLRSTLIASPSRPGATPEE